MMPPSFNSAVCEFWVAGTQKMFDSHLVVAILLKAMRDGEKSESEQLTDLEKSALPTGRMPGGIVLREPGRGDGKRRRMVFDDRDCFYHTMSRTAGGEMLFGDVEKEAFRKMMWRLSRFSGVEIMTYAVMGNHFHLLIRVPRREMFLRRFRQAETEGKSFGGHDEEKLLEHLKLLYSEAYLVQLRAELSLMKEQGTKRMAELYEKTIQGFYKRFCSMEHFMKELKERFTRWFNKRHGRYGTLWQSRYKSVLVGDGEALKTMAAYIDLNPLRAGLVEDPKDYRWCGYAEAVGGSKRVRRGLCRSLGVPIDDWEKTGRGEVGGGELYRRLLLTDGMEREQEEAVKREDGKVHMIKKRGFDRKKALEQLEKGGCLSREELLRCRVRYFSEGLVIGSQDFVEAAFEARRSWFGRKRKSGAQRLPLKGKGFCSLREMRVQAVE